MLIPSYILERLFERCAEFENEGSEYYIRTDDETNTINVVVMFRPDVENIKIKIEVQNDTEEVDESQEK